MNETDRGRLLISHSSEDAGASGVVFDDHHDENVLTQHGMLYCIDTVFYLTDAFWKE